MSFRRALPGVISLAIVAGISLTALAPLPSETAITDNAVLAERLTPAEVPDFLGSHYGLAVEALSKDPAVVATWWQSLTDTARYRLTVRMPEIIGNLAGVDFTARDAANRVQLERYLNRALEAHSLHPQDTDLAKKVLALQAITGALNFKSVPRFLVQLTTDQMPLAAIAVGNLDTARMVTYAVPGMGTYTTDMQLWTRAASNIYQAQTAAGASRQAVVAWVGYRTPPVGIEATRDAYADRGAHLLQRDILGLRSSRGDNQPIINIVGHSYGATTAAKALKPDLGIRSFVMLGSAGVDRSVGDAAALPAELVFSGEAAADHQARWGRVDRNDPNTLAFGATHLKVEASQKAGLRGVTGHEPILHSPWNDDPESPAWTKYADADTRSRLFDRHMESFGYLDASTQSLEAVGHATTPPSVRGRAGA
jgi:hypothetical protein